MAASARAGHDTNHGAQADSGTPVFRFLDLPAELRNAVYDIEISRSKKRYHWDDDEATSPQPPALLQTNQQIRNEMYTRYLNTSKPCVDLHKIGRYLNVFHPGWQNGNTTKAHTAGGGICLHFKFPGYQDFDIAGFLRWMYSRPLGFAVDFWPSLDAKRPSWPPVIDPIQLTAYRTELRRLFSGSAEAWKKHINGDIKRVVLTSSKYDGWFDPDAVHPVLRVDFEWDGKDRTYPIGYVSKGLDRLDKFSDKRRGIVEELGFVAGRIIEYRFRVPV